MRQNYQWLKLFAERGPTTNGLKICANGRNDTWKQQDLMSKAEIKKVLNFKRNKPDLWMK